MLSFAIEHGHVEYKTIWELDKTRIKLSLAGVDGTTFISIAYISKDYLDFLSEDLDENLYFFLHTVFVLILDDTTKIRYYIFYKEIKFYEKDCFDSSLRPFSVYFLW